MKRIVIGAVVLVLAIGGVGFWYWYTWRSSATTFKSEEVVRGQLIARVSSTGTLQAKECVDVGAQVLGRIIYIGPDTETQSGIIDWGSEVHGPRLAPFTATVTKDSNTITMVSDMTDLWVGQVLTSKTPGFPPGTSIKTLAPGSKSITMTARYTGESATLVSINVLGTLVTMIDPALYEAQRDANQATAAQAEASVLAAEGDLGVKTAALNQATADWGRAQTLIKTGGIQRAEYDQFEANFASTTANLKFSKANLEVAKAQVFVTKAQLSAAQANLRNAQANLDYCTITAPVSGKVVDRRVNMGQTVVASLSTPSLFLIAKDLKKMEVWATVNEVDVGKIKAGQKVEYTVDSCPGESFEGQVVPQGKLPYRLNAAMNQNVVTYTVVVSVANEKELLMPYMTTNLSFIVENKENALLVPNAALRWQPTRQQIAPEQRDEYTKLKNQKSSATDAGAQNQGVIWVQEADGFVHFTRVKIGQNDGSRTEITGVIGNGTMPAEHTKVVVGEVKLGVSGDTANPFGVKMFQSTKAKE
jgi:HlyD family secretion protein